jgi:hypothetical protein
VGNSRKKSAAAELQPKRRRFGFGVMAAKNAKYAKYAMVGATPCGCPADAIVISGNRHSSEAPELNDLEAEANILGAANSNKLPG